MRALIVVVVMLLIGACDGASPEARAVLQPDAVVVLEEPADDPIGQPVHVAIGEDGEIALIDRLSPGVILFTAEGERRRRFGSVGTGPGEIETARLAVFLPGDRIGVVGEGGQRGIFVFDIGSGAYIETIPLQTPPSSATPIPEGFLFGAMNLGNGTSVTELDLSTTRERPFGPIPPGDGYRDGGPVPGIFHRVFAAPAGAGTIVIGFEPLSELVLVGDATGAQERLELPRRRRRGTPEGLEERLREAMRRSYEQVFAQGSVLSFMAPVDEGRILLVHQDLMPQIPAVPEAVFMTVVDLNRRAACVDVPVPFDPDTPATFALNDERLGVLQQEIDEAGGGAPAVLRWYRLNLGACTWDPLQALSAA